MDVNAVAVSSCLTVKKIRLIQMKGLVSDNNRRQVIKTTVARLLEDFILLVKLLREY